MSNSILSISVLTVLNYCSSAAQIITYMSPCKGVHSCAQVCSCKIILPSNKTTDDVRQLINQHLPDDIRILDVVRTTRNFCARTSRGRVRYQYMLPSYLLFPRESLKDTFEQVGCTDAQNRPPRDPLTDHETSCLQQNRKFMEYRALPEQLQSLRDALQSFQGTNTFHNYTRGLSHKDASASRYIVSFTVGEPVLSPISTSVNDTKMQVEWVPTQVVGQSFLLNQIRKMISMAVDVARGFATMDSLKESLSNCKMKTGTAPAEGLFLDMSYYDGYNNRGVSEPLDWVRNGQDETPAMQRWKKFKEEQVMNKITQEGFSHEQFLKYLFIQEFIFDKERSIEDGHNEDDHTAVISANAETATLNNGDSNKGDDDESRSQNANKTEQSETQPSA
mmetsp:Transcript_3448/g.4687  ORF Transcript_3448/g.4687 Transcript_3448/m.4687 type:complete len:391 (+) Transcript_3448:711-1883(+)